MGDRVKLTVPCLFCGKDHSVICSSHAFLHQQAAGLLLRRSPVWTAATWGRREPVFAALKRLEEAVDKLEPKRRGEGQLPG